MVSRTRGNRVPMINLNMVSKRGNRVPMINLNMVSKRGNRVPMINLNMVSKRGNRVPMINLNMVSKRGNRVPMINMNMVRTRGNRVSSLCKHAQYNVCPMYKQFLKIVPRTLGKNAQNCCTVYTFGGITEACKSGDGVCVWRPCRRLRERCCTLEQIQTDSLKYRN
jgi:hypothetical protein